ncbi:MAG TPA: DNA-processing protein DprA [Steroidobacteraceae bacterium]|nr:DNA-processing protein DprA [Steroidobacteraceae bacterium]
MDERRAWAILARAPGLAARHVHTVLTTLGDLPQVASARSAGERRLLAQAGWPAGARAFLEMPPHARIDADLRWLDTSGARLIPCTSPGYPPLLSALASAPPVLWVLGDASVLVVRSLAMVGARKATPGGCATAREFARVFVNAGLVVASGLALGIDAASHSSALAAGGTTIAVCAHGLDGVYPPEHRELAAQIRARGVLVSRFAPGCPPRRRHFPQRNRDLSGMAVGTLVIEAARVSGSLLTARSALEQGRPVFAVPGSVRNPLAAGCHALIRQGARLAESPHDVLDELAITYTKQKLAPEASRLGARSCERAPLDKDSEILLDALDFEPVSIDTIVERTGLPSGRIASMLLILELRGRVLSHPGGRYCRLP